MTAPNNYAENAALKQRFVRVMGGPLGTGGRGAVALRCDHGLANFRDRVLPLTVARRISVSQAYNPRNWHYPENAGVTIEELDDWVADGRVEIWNHSASHASAESAAQLRDQIVGGLQEIQEQLPAARGKVWGWSPPGVKGGYGGYDGGKRPEGWHTPAGRMILKHHAVAQGSLYRTHLRVLDGTPRVGLARYQMDSRAVDDIVATIDTAARERLGLQLMIHPSVLDKPGFLTTAELEAVLDHIVTHRERGQLKTLSPYQLLVADASLAEAMGTSG